MSLDIRFLRRYALDVDPVALTGSEGSSGSTSESIGGNGTTGGTGLVPGRLVHDVDKFDAGFKLQAATMSLPSLNVGPRAPCWEALDILTMYFAVSIRRWRRVPKLTVKSLS